jgi:hypothetical protein
MSDHWKSLAQKLGAPGLAAPEESGSESTSPITQESVAPPAPVEKPAAPPAPVEAAEMAKPRKRSSWETLASMFNIQLDRTPAAPEPVAPPPEPAPTPVKHEPRAAVEPKRENRRDQPPRARDDSRRGGFKREEGFSKRDEPVAEERLSVFNDTRTDTNPALEALFADAPREEVTSWKRTPRVVDDLGWDDDAPVSEDREPISGESSPVRDVEAEDGDEPRKRSRRRRRGSRKPRPTDDVVAREPIADDLDAVDSGDPWVEPESFESDLAEEPDVEPIDPERRSRRRRRRGRKRSSDEVSSVDSPVVDGEDRPVRSADRTEQADRPERERSPRTERPERSDRRERPSRHERAERTARSDDDPPREKRPPRGDRPERPPRVRDERPAPVINPEDEELDEMDAIDAAEKHRNIPNWVDSLQAIIEANIENHKRNDNRGGPPRGRPRSRR